MRLRKAILAALALTLVSRAALGCPEGKTWHDFSAVSLTTGGAWSLTLARFADGLYTRVADEKSVKEMYQLANGLHLFKGYDPSEEAGPSPFFMLDMPVGMILRFLTEYFPQPCAVGSSPASFSYASAYDTIKFVVKGHARLTNRSTIDFDVDAREQRENGASIQASGTVAFLALTPIPSDTIISDWVITRAGRSGAGAEVIDAQRTVSTFGELRTVVEGNAQR